MKTPIEIMLDNVEWVKNKSDKDHENDLPWATHEGVLEIGGIRLRCYRLNTGQAIFNADDVNELFGLNE